MATTIPLYSMSGDVITTFTSDELEFCSVNTLVEDMEYNECRGVPGARCDETDTIFVERFFLIIGERILGEEELVVDCLSDTTNAGKRLILYKKPIIESEDRENDATVLCDSFRDVP